MKQATNCMWRQGLEEANSRWPLTWWMSNSRWCCQVLWWLLGNSREHRSSCRMQQLPCKVRLQLSVVTWTLLVLTYSNYGVLQHDFSNVYISLDIGWTSVQRVKCDAMKHWEDCLLGINFIIQFEAKSLIFINYILQNINNIMIHSLFVVYTWHKCVIWKPNSYTDTYTHARTHAHARTVRISGDGTCIL